MKFCIFCERIFDDECFEALKAFCEKQLRGGVWQILNDPCFYPRLYPENVKLFCLTPVNYELAVAEQGYTGTKAQLSKIMAERYRELSWMGCDIDLHLHLSLRPEKLSLKQEDKMFKEAIDWMKKNGFNCKEWMAGWYLFSDQSIKLGKKYGLKYTLSKGFYQIHEYELYGNIYSIIMILQNVRHLFR